LTAFTFPTLNVPASIVTEGEEDAAAAKAGRRAIERSFMAIVIAQEDPSQGGDIQG
jgi:hypothetical protein